MTEPRIMLKITDIDGKVKRVGSRKPRRIYHFLQADRSKDCLFNLRVVYGKGKGNNNEGNYKTKEESLYALKLFLEADT